MLREVKIVTHELGLVPGAVNLDHIMAMVQEVGTTGYPDVVRIELRDRQDCYVSGTVEGLLAEWANAGLA